MRSPVLHWVSLRLRILLGMILLVASLLPPYIPVSATSGEDIPVASRQFLFVEEGFLMKSSSLGTQGTRLAYSEGLVHHVKDGESLEALSQRYGVSVQTIRWANNLEEASIQPGQDLVILPVDGVIHTVRRGQTLGRIAQLYDVAQDQISAQNHVRGGFITVGQQLIIPGGKPIGNLSTAVAVEAGGELRFGDKLPERDIQLRLNLPGSNPPKTPGAAPAVSAVISSTTLQMPCENCTITQQFHPGHYALDIQTKGSGPIFAAEAGTVIRADYGWNGGYGNVIEVDHGNGLVTLYAHNRELYVKEGDTVGRGQQIAWMGNSGLVHGPTGIHVHFEVRVNGVKKNPLLYLE